MSLFVVFTLLITLIATIYFYINYKFSYWKRRGVPFVKPSIPFGNFGPLFKRTRSFGQNIHELYYKSNGSLLGVYIALRPALLIRDPKISRDILIKDFQSFWHRGFHYDDDNDPLAANLFSYSGDRWRTMRGNLSPAFTAGKLKAMVENIVECGKSLEDYLNGYVLSGKDVEVGEVFTRFTTNVIASVSFGLDVDCFKYPNHELREYGRRWFGPHLRNSIRFNGSYVSPFLMKLFKFRFADKEIKDFMTETVLQNIKYREENNIVRKDFFQLLLQIRNAGKVQDDDDWGTKVTSDKKLLSVNDITAQAYVFFLGAYESSSTMMSFCLYELAKQPNIQQKLYKEINDTLQKYGGKINYESLSEMKYLDCCIDETLRIHPPFDVFTRECTKDYKIADTDIIIEKGTLILFSVSGPQHDSKYYDEPKNFIPERFVDDQNPNRNSLTTPYLAFGDGPRNCIGIRLGKIQAKIGLCLLLQKFSFELGAHHSKFEFAMDPRTGVRAAVNGVHLKVKAR